jgi:hypothetical protein
MEVAWMRDAGHFSETYMVLRRPAAVREAEKLPAGASSW